MMSDEEVAIQEASTYTVEELSRQVKRLGDKICLTFEDVERIENRLRIIKRAIDIKLERQQAYHE